MLGPLSKTIHGVVNFTWPMVVISVIILVTMRIAYLIKNHEHFTLYKELLMLAFVIYILCLFQVVTFQDTTSWSSNNFIPFREMFRYNIGSRLFFKNVLGNMLMFLPFGFFVSYYLKNEKWFPTFVIVLIASCSIETVQMLIGRVYDVDDIILNIIGGTLGHFIYFFLNKVGNKVPKIFKKELFLDILAIIVLILLIVVL